MNSEVIIDELLTANYISCDSNGQINIYRTLREIGKAYDINYTTISKAFSVSKNKNICLCKSKSNGIIVIRKLDNI
tara:strand:+ start:10 stop:237 length:228 start_codon:yes stop_codon:yes gene_type:complete